MRKTVILISLLLAALSASAQTTAVTATVVDSDSTVWANGTWTLAFQVGVHQSNPAAYTIGGSPLDKAVAYQSGTADGSGVITFTNYQSTAIQPAGSSWNLTVCPNASSACATINFSTGASTLNLSSQINAAIVAPRFLAVSGAYGYNDTEAAVQLRVGNTYWNVTTPCQRYFSGITWACGGSGPGGGATGSNYQLQYYCGGLFCGAAGGNTNSTGTHFAFGPSAVIDDPQYSSPGILTIENVSPDTSITGLAGINSNILWSPSGSVTEGAFAANTLNVTTDFDNALSIAVNPSSALSVGMTDTTTGSTAGAYITAANYSTTVGNASGTEVDGIVGGVSVGTGTWTSTAGVNWTVELNGTTASYAAGSTFFGTVAGASNVGTVAGFAAGDFSINDTATVPNVASAWLIANPIASPNVTNNIGLYIDGVFNGDWTGGANNYALLSTSTALSQFDGLIQSPALIETAAAPTVTSGQVGFGGTTAAASNCNQGGVLTDVAGCLIINVAGTTHYVPYF